MKISEFLTNQIVKITREISPMREIIATLCESLNARNEWQKQCKFTISEQKQTRIKIQTKQNK